MKEYALEVKNCDDLMLSFIVAKYYPYFAFHSLKSRTKGGIELKSGPKAVYQGKSHYTIRHKCLQKYS